MKIVYEIFHLKCMDIFIIFPNHLKYMVYENVHLKYMVYENSL